MLPVILTKILTCKNLPKLLCVLSTICTDKSKPKSNKSVYYTLLTKNKEDK